MKILSKEEKDAHVSHIIAEGAKGLVYGGILSVGIFQFLKHKRPARFALFTPSIKAALLAMPTITIGAFYADQGSVEFDRKMHQSEYNESKYIEEFREWNKLSLSDKCFTVLNDNKYKIIIAAWAGSLYGSWVFVNRDKIMTTAQKAVQARMYAQGITIILLLGTILLAMKEEEINKKKPKPIPEWKKIIMEKEAEDQRLLEEAKLAKEKAQTPVNTQSQ
ncbi:Respiratory supercomplex factor 2, mitochondrial [Candida viswanathii]|uniref:Respiratory supercomplex factor 2, mitochondrial n=1 Tax=Candida viswanathii TaxID=5486 RepID=A0A367YGH1_9ASCO|nr:Respiratory supercomplex factor 2, mitochondrial [Candida viswanathii]